MENDVRGKILECFLYSDELRFSEIERAVGERSNKLSYHLGKLVGSGVLRRNGEVYLLSEDFEDMIPYISSKKHVLTVMLVHVGDARRAFLVDRKKRPYMGKLALPGGRMVLGESLEEGAGRILKKFGVKMSGFLGVRSVSLEHLKRDGKVVGSYLLVYVGAEADAEMVDLDRREKDIIESDLFLIRKDSSKGVNLVEIDSLV